MTEPWLEDLHTQTVDHLERLARVQDALITAYGEASAGGGRVVVRVNPAGRPTAITLAPSAMSLPAADLAAAILSASDRASARADELVSSLLADLVPAAEVSAMLTGTATQADRDAVLRELSALRETQSGA